MARNQDDSYLSELERELELEMDDLELENESELDEELSDEEFENASDYEEDSQQQEFELDEGETGDYAERFYELSQMEFESESELDRELEGLLNGMERDYFFGGIKKFIKSKGKGLIKKGLKYAAGRVPALQALKGITQLARGNLKGSLLALAKTALAAHPAGAAALPALKALGFETSEDSEANREAWDNYVEVARESYEHLAQNLNENADSPLEASRLATNAFQTALRQQGGRKTSQQRARRFKRGGVTVGSGRKRQIVYIDRDVEEVVIRRR